MRLAAHATKYRSCADSAISASRGGGFVRARDPRIRGGIPRNARGEIEARSLIGAVDKSTLVRVSLTLNGISISMSVRQDAGRREGCLALPRKWCDGAR